MTDPVEQVRAYLEAWNTHDPGGVLATFAPGGTSQDPTTPGPVSGEGIAASVSGLLEMLPDVRFDTVWIGGISPTTVVARWLMEGTNLGPIAGLPPTGRSVSLPGVDFIEVGPDGISRVQGFYDRQIVSDQLGLKTYVLPERHGPFQFGIAATINSGKAVMPGAVSLTRLGSNPEDKPELKVFDIAAQMQGLPGFLSWIGVEIGTNNYTISAWENEADVPGLLKIGTHREAMKEVFSGLHDLEVTTSVWALDRANKHWVRCGSCLQMTDLDAVNSKCPCGADLPEPTPYW